MNRVAYIFALAGLFLISSKANPDQLPEKIAEWKTAADWSKQLFDKSPVKRQEAAIALTQVRDGKLHAPQLVESIKLTAVEVMNMVLNEPPKHAPTTDKEKQTVKEYAEWETKMNDEVDAYAEMLRVLTVLDVKRLKALEMAPEEAAQIVMNWKRLKKDR